MKGVQKLLLLVTLLVLAFGFLPLLAQPLPYKELDWLSYEATMYYGDAYEPDDSRNLAKAIQVDGAVQLRNFHVRRDQDWVWFYATKGTSYAVETRARPIGSLADTVLELYDYTGQLLDSDDDGGELTDARLPFMAEYTGIHYARVTEWADRFGDVYWYHLAVVKVLPHKIYLPVVTKDSS
jgi:hypothetical protein